MPRIDGSSNMSFESSVKRVTEKLSQSEKEDFYAALDYLARSRMNQSDMANFSGWNRMEFTQHMMSQIREDLHGYTASEVIDKAVELRDQQK